ncbi:MAG: sigma-70 family RNA polymerase sigma factor [Clostridia bacterium]|nr:sigma-70 family RNA polymerase sigma factor [Clostridia bacterium]
MMERDGEQLNRLILAVAHGHADCLDGIYNVAGGRMYAVALSIVGKDNAEDVLHDSFIKIARFARSYGRGMNPFGWVLKIVRNTALDFLRARSNRAEVSTEEFFSLTSLDYSPEKRENAIMLEQALSRLEPDERKIIYYTYYLDMTVRDIAAELNLSKSAVQRTKERAEAKLKTLLDGGTN